MSTLRDDRAARAAAAAVRDPGAIVREGYDRASHRYRADDFEYARSGYRYWLGRLGRRLAPGSRVLDLGCGNGIPVARELANRHRVTGVDLSPVQIERAREAVPGAAFRCADMTEVEFERASFEAVTAFWSVINVPLERQPALFGRIARWLVPGGWLLAVVGRVAWTGIERNWRDVPGLDMYYSHADVRTYRTWLANAGFAIEEDGVQPKHGNPGYSVLIARLDAPAAGDPGSGAGVGRPTGR